ncbi:MAG: heterodisulfide reductase-related iron-sulfur binding cluster [Verrucomicrobiales bacterium]|nr:heterodisulfide reductase-related iron-sulfur binding cluster [Verrucomicrobiales bacterium]
MSSGEGVSGGAMEPAMREAIRTCVHCGFCLAACPTYRELGEEMDSPRGRIVLMEKVLDGELEPQAAQPYIDRCLGCLACEPACPSGVEYRHLISPYRAAVEVRSERSLAETVRRRLVGLTVPFPGRFRAGMTLASMAKPLRAILPLTLRGMVDLAPKRVPEAVELDEVNPAVGEPRMRVAMLAGCAQQVLAPAINQATIEVLTRNGVEVIVPKEQGCCGSLGWHVGDLEGARAMARRNVGAFAGGFDAVVTNAAGCGSGMAEYGLMLKGTADEKGGESLAAMVVDVSVVLGRLGQLAGFPDDGVKLRVAYQDACHLSHGQGVTLEPRELLRAVPGVELLELRDASQCCGSAGSYNLDQPEIAAELGRNKAEAIVETGCDVVVTGNIGCYVQVQSHLERLGSRVRVLHTMELVAAAYRGELEKLSG